MFKRITICALLGFGTLAATTSNAFAMADAGVILAVNQANRSITMAVNRGSNNIANAINGGGGTSVVQALKLLSGQNTVNNNTLIKALGNINTLRDNRYVTSKIEQATLNAVNQSSNGAAACNMITGTIAGQSINAQVAQAQEQGMNQELAYLTGGDKQHPSASYNGRNAAITALIGAHCKYSATQQDVDEGLCPKVTAPQSTQPGAAGQVGNTVPADIKANYMINPPNHVVPKDMMPSMQNFLLLAFNPSPMGSMPPGSAKSPAGREQAYERLVMGAQKAIPDTIASEILAKNQPLPSGSETITSGSVSSSSTSINAQSWADKMMSNIAGAGTVANDNYFPSGISENAWIAVRAKGWYMNPNWAVQLNTDDESSAVKDLTMIEAFRAFLQDKQYQQQQQELLLLSSIDSVLHRMANKQ